MLNYDLIPNNANMRGGVQRYIEQGIRPGGFLTALFANDLLEAFARADMSNQAVMFEWARWIYNEAPRSCHGSYEIVKDWCSEIQLRNKEDSVE